MTQRATAAAPAPALIPFTVIEPRALLERINKLHEAIESRAYEIFRGHGELLHHDLDNWLKAEAELLHPVHIDLKESHSSLNVTAEVPGFEAKDLQISLEPGRLTIAGKRESQKEEKEKGRTIYSEQCSDEILRVVDLPAEVDIAKTTATLKNGVLSLKMPKIAGAKKQIGVKAG